MTKRGEKTPSTSPFPNAVLPTTSSSCRVHLQGRSTHNGLYGQGRRGFSANHTSICVQHPVQLPARDCIVFTQVWFLAEKHHKIYNQPYQPTDFDFLRRPFGKWLRIHYLNHDSAQCVIFVNGVQTGCVNGWGLLGRIG